MPSAGTNQSSNAREVITRELAAFLRRSRIREVHFGRATSVPPALAYVTSFPRLSIALSGSQHVEIAHELSSVQITLSRGCALYVGRNCWNKPDWRTPVKILTLLFGKSQIGVSLVSHDGKGEEPPAMKTTISPFEGTAQHILSALATVGVEPRPAPLDRLLTESILHACHRLLTGPVPAHQRKAARTFEALSLYVHEHFQNRLTRESVARAFGLSPNHVSRLFRQEGGMGFNDFLTLVRIDRAKYMLKQYSSPLKEIAASCGFHDLAYFCRVFRRLTRTTPTTYRLS